MVRDSSPPSSRSKAEKWSPGGSGQALASLGPRLVKVQKEQSSCTATQRPARLDPDWHHSLPQILPAKSDSRGLECAETIFHFADELHELRLGDDLWMPAEVAFDQVVGFDDM